MSWLSTYTGIIRLKARWASMIKTYIGRAFLESSSLVASEFCFVGRSSCIDYFFSSVNDRVDGNRSYLILNKQKLLRWMLIVKRGHSGAAIRWVFITDE